MDISKGLILKGTAATTAVATTSTGAYYHEEIGDIWASLFFGENAGEGLNQPVGGGLKGQRENAGDGTVGSDGEHLSEHGNGGAGRSDQVTVSPSVSKEKTGKDSLGLPENWDWPTDDEKTKTSNLTAEQLKTVNFDGKTEGESLSVSGEVALTIEKVDESTDFPQGFKFIFKTKDSNDVTITGGSAVSITLKEGMDLEFKIKVVDGKWSLEKAWDINKLAEKAGMINCGSESKCAFDENKTFNVKDGNGKVTGITIGESKKLKFEGGQKGYNQGFKFTAEESIALTGATNGNGVSKLKNGATYEIKEENEGGTKKWFLVKKTPSNKEKENEEINKKLNALGIPTTCRLEGERKLKDCKLTDDDLKAIKFEGKESNDLSISSTGNDIKLKIEKVDGSEDAYGTEKLKFTFENKKILNASAGSLNLNWSAKTNPEYKIKGSGDSSTLERAWTVSELGKKVGLICAVTDSSSGAGECTFSGNIKVYEDKNKKSTQLTVSADANNKKLEFTENQKDHNQGFKFLVKGGEDITLTPGDTVASLAKANTSYEIKYYENDDWYLSKKTSSVTK